MSKIVDNQPILVHAPNWLGDHVMAFPFYRALRHQFPNNRLHLLGRTWVSGLQPDGVFNKIHHLEGKQPGRELYAALRSEGFGLAFTLSPSFRSARHLHRLRIPYRIGFASDYRSLLLRWPSRRKVPWSEHEHRSLSYIRLLTPFLTDLRAEDVWRHTINMREKAPRPMPANLARQIGPHPFWIVCPGTVAPSKVYPITYLAEVIDTILRQNRRHRIVMVGSEIEKPFAQTLLQGVSGDLQKRLIDLTTRTTLPQLLSVLARARGVIANDSGVAHMTFLTKTPLVTFIGMARREETLTLNQDTVVLDERLPCSPCKKQRCPRKDYPLECLDRIKPPRVLAAMKTLDKKLVIRK